jgi:dipeptidyl aminopeptidase/acylaminoacyl peptidase
MTTSAPFGSWRSPITSDLIVSETVRLGQVRCDGSNTYWVEMRPSEGGRNVVIQLQPDGSCVERTPPEINARTGVHEYGGGAYVVEGGVVYTSNFYDHRLYRCRPGAPPVPITAGGGRRYADAVYDRRWGRLICVREVHSAAGQPENTLAAIRVDGSGGESILVAGGDFYSSPRVSPDGFRLAWVTWNHPNMPWDGTELWVGDFCADGSVGNRRLIAGGREESIFQPEWSPDGDLAFVSDRSGWWNLYLWDSRTTHVLWDVAKELGRPQWVFGMSTYGFESENTLICAVNEKAVWGLVRLWRRSGRVEPLETPCSDISDIRVARGRAVFCGGSPTEVTRVVELDLRTHEHRVLRTSADVHLDAGYLAVPTQIEFSTDSGLESHAFFYRPRNRDFRADSTQRPPLLVMSHGGPTSSASSKLKLETQYWTSRGFAVLDVNYGGSTGFGREYRRRLDGKWGLVDVADCVHGARYLVKNAEVDGEQLAIRGGSAGGYTTLCALVFTTAFKAAASYYGVSDLETLARDTHKFESRYMDRLIGPYPSSQQLYRQRSPVHFIDALSCPVIFFQGAEDKIVPPSQAEQMVKALRRKGLPVAYLLFEDEQHGFRKAETIKRSLDAELYFYSRVFGFSLPDPVAPIFIENLP